MTISLKGGGRTVTEKTPVLCCKLQVGSQVDGHHLSVSTPCLLAKLSMCTSVVLDSAEASNALSCCLNCEMLLRVAAAMSGTALLHQPAALPPQHKGDLFSFLLMF